jgi:hypothetical protein
MRVIYLTIITVIENKMRLVKRMFAELVLNAARNDKSADQQGCQNENVEASSGRRRDFYRPHHRNMAGLLGVNPTSRIRAQSPPPLSIMPAAIVKTF